MATPEQHLGRYVRIEGLDGSGKTTQLDLAREYSKANNLDAVFVREPGGTELGLHLRSLLLEDKTVKLSPGTETLLFTADRLHAFETVTLPALNEDKTVIGDRGIESTEAYQSAGGGIAAETIRELGRLMLPRRYMEPDAVAILQISPEVRRERMRKSWGLDKIEERDAGYFERAAAAYFAMESLTYVRAINADRDPEEIFNDLRPILFGPEHA